MNLKQATEILSADTPQAAGARTIIKRTLRKMRLPADVDAETLAGFFVAHPWACTVGIERRLKDSARALARSTSNRQTSAAEEAKHQLYAEHIETLMSLINVQMDWPGLYPTYNYVGSLPEGFPPGRFGECYDLASLWTLLRDIRAYEAENA